MKIETTLSLVIVAIVLVAAILLYQGLSNIGNGIAGARNSFTSDIGSILHSPIDIADSMWQTTKRESNKLFRYMLGSEGSINYSGAGANGSW